MLSIHQGPDYDRLRSDPRFQDLIHRAVAIDYGRMTGYPYITQQGKVCRQPTQNRRPHCDGMFRAIISRTDGPYLWHEARTL
jgi:hypothetical protein